MLSFYLAAPVLAVAAPAETILFLGSSSIEKWEPMMASHFPGYRTSAIAKGGSDFPWLIGHAEAAVEKQRPDRIVIYSGDNDLANRDTPETVTRNFEKLIGVIRTAQQKYKISFAPIYVLSIKPAPGRREILGQVRATNALLRASIARMTGITFVDVFSQMIGADDVIPAQNFDSADPSRIHLSPAGYKLWAGVLLQQLKKP